MQIYKTGIYKFYKKQKAVKKFNSLFYDKKLISIQSRQNAS